MIVRRFRALIPLMAMVVAGGVATSSASARDHADLVKVSIAYPNTSVHSVPIFLGVGEGIYERYGLDVSLVNGSGSKGAALLTSGSADIALGPADLFLTPDARGAKFVLLSEDLNRYTGFLVAKKSIKTVPDLKGHKLALSSPGGAVDAEGHAVLKKYGLTDKDVTIVYISNVAARNAALLTGSVDASIGAPVANLLQNSNLHQVRNDYDLRTLSYGSWTSRSWATSNQDVIKRVIRADVATTKFIRNPKNKAVVEKYIEDKTGFSDQGSVDEEYEDLTHLWQVEPLIDPKSLANSLADAKAETGVTLDRNAVLFDGPLAAVLTYGVKAGLARVSHAKAATGATGTLAGSLNPSGVLHWNVRTKNLSSKITAIELLKGTRVRVTLCARRCRATGSVHLSGHVLEQEIKGNQDSILVKTKKNPRGELRGKVTAVTG